MPRVRFLTVAVLMVFLCSCASTKKKAKEHLEGGSFDEAVLLYEQALREDPNDAEARVGLKQARDGVLDKGLISVRMARLASNQQQAADLLLEVIKKEQSWNHTPTSKVAFTQSEESTFAVNFLQGRIKTVIQERKPLFAEAILMNYKPIFQDPTAVSRFDSLKREVFQSGKETCNKFQNESRKDSPYFADFLVRYCTHFGEDCEQCSTWSKSKLQDLYQRADVSGPISDLPEDLSTVVRKDLQASFEETAWYDAGGAKRVSLLIKGAYHYSHQKDLASLVHQYQIQEPYEAWEEVLKSRQVPYTDYESRYDYQSHQTRSVPVTKYRTEYYKEPQRVVRYRTVDKVYPYSALKHQQKIDLSVTGSCDLADRHVDISFQDSTSEEGFEHDLNLPDIGLRPSKPQFQDSSLWVKNNAKRVSQQFKEKAQAEWAASYCKADSSTSDPKVLSDRVQKCLRSKVTPLPSFVSEWYETQLGLSYEKAEQILSK